RQLLAVLVGSHAAGRQRCGAHGQQRPDPGQHRAAAARPSGAVAVGGPATNGEFRRRLLDAGVLQEAGPLGLYARSRAFENVIDGLQRAVRADLGDAAPTQLSMPWVVSSDLLVATDYATSFPDLTGVLIGFDGGDAEHARLRAAVQDGGDWIAE